MATIKEEVISLVKKMPENTTLEDIMEHIYVKQKILKGQKQLESGQFYTHEEAKEIISNTLIGWGKGIIYITSSGSFQWGHVFPG